MIDPIEFQVYESVLTNRDNTGSTVADIAANTGLSRGRIVMAVKRLLSKKRLLACTDFGTTEYLAV